MKNLLLILTLFLISMPVLAQTPQTKSNAETKTADLQPPQGWGRTGSQRDHYEFYSDFTVKRGGKASGTLKAKTTAPKDGFGATIQSIRADNYRGKRIRLSGYLKTENVADWTGFWLRIDGEDPSWHLDFDNMRNRPVKGTTDWKKYESVLDVPEKAELIVFGVTLNGAGQVWADDIQIEVVGKDVASTSLMATPETEKAKKEAEEWKKNKPEEYERFIKSNNEIKKKRPLEAVNLDFEN